MSTLNLAGQGRAPAAPIIDDPRRRRSILLAVCIALMAVIAAVSGLNVAQPQMALALDGSQGEHTYQQVGIVDMLDQQF